MARNFNRGGVQMNEMEENVWSPAEIDNTEELTLLSAVCQIVEVATDSQYDKRIFEAAARPIAYIADKLGLTEKQVLVYALAMDLYYDRAISVRDIARRLDISALKAIMFSADLEELCRRNYLAENEDMDTAERCYSVTRSAIDALKQDRAISGEKPKIESSEDWFSALDKICAGRLHRRISYEDARNRVIKLIKDNSELPMVEQLITKAKDMSDDEIMLFLWLCNLVVTADFETFQTKHFRKLYSDAAMYRAQCKAFALGKSNLIKLDLVRVASSDEQKSKDNYELTPWVVTEMLAEFDLETTTACSKNNIIEHTTITPKQLFYNAREQKAIEQLSQLLQPERFAQVKDEMQKQGLRSGFACLFHGAPGTGKTETVLQLARATGRDLMQVNISEIKSMWVGESEKNIKDVFTRYRKLVAESAVAPILLFNEADAIIGKRLENVQRSVDKMENSMQNIILEEIEKLDGILIATTNLTCNMDKAFERRFIYKIEFDKPCIEAKSAIWHSMIPDLSADDVCALATKYDFSGGQIENIARKSVVDKILSGEPFSLDTLCEHCDSEILDAKKERKPIGF